MSLTRDQILDAKDRTLEPVDVPEWGGTLYLQQMSAAQAATFRAAMLQAVDSQTASIVDAELLTRMERRVVAWCATDADGKRLFTDEDADTLLGDKSPAVITRLSEKALELSALTEEPDTRKKKSAKTPSKSSGTG